MSDVAASLRTYGTIQFGLEQMRAQIKLGSDTRHWMPGQAVGGASIDGTLWWSFVPEIYRPQLAPIADEVARKFIGRKLTPDLLAELVHELHRRIWSEVEPR